MATSRDYAAEYVRRLRAVQEEEAERIAAEIDGLYYADTGRPIQHNEKLAIVDAMRQVLNAPVDEYVPADDGIAHLGSADARAHLSIVRAIKNLLK